MRDDVERIRNNKYGYNEKILQRIEKDIMNLEYMPRIYKTLISVKDPTGEYRRMISGKYSVIYKIVKDKVIILRIFNQKENYLNQRKFILREENQIYFINKRRTNMIKLRILKNSYAKLKKNFIHIITEEEALNRYMNLLINEAEENLKNEEKIITIEEWREELIREYNVVL